MNPDVFTELSIILAITLVITGIMRVLKQPAIIGYILSGIIAGPVVLNIIQSTQTLNAFSHLGVALLLFLVGLNLNPKVIKDVGKIALITGIGQVVFTTGVGYLIAKGLGFETTTAIYIAIALAFSSTIVIMKLLSDKKDFETLYGRISIGFLIIQDFIAILLLLGISSLSTGMDLKTLAVETLLKGIGGIALLFLLTKYLLPKLTKNIAKSQEFLLLFSLTWCFAVATVFHHLNFSIEAGALLAGITLSMSPYHHEISSRMKPLRDFFIILFFIMLGAQMTFTDIASSIWIILAFSFFVLIGNPIIVMALMGFFGYTKKNSFLAGLTVAQISEFSFILVAMGMSAGHVDANTLSIVTAVGLITFAGSTYMILYSHKIYPKIARFLSIFERKGKKVDEHEHHHGSGHDILLFGYNRIGFDILESLQRIKKAFLVIDYDPQVITTLAKEGYDSRYGDADDPELLDELDFENAKMIISTIPDIDTNLMLINKAKEMRQGQIIAVVAHQMEEAIKLYDKGATYVIMPHFLGGKHFSTMLEKNELSAELFIEEKIRHLEHLKERKKRGHEHPTHH